MRKSEIRYVSMFSGIEAATVAWHELGWKAVAFSDFDKFPKEVLAHHYPDVPDLGDVTKVDWNEYEGKADLVVGGSPCQSFSVAGKRLGMDDPRGNLALHFLGAVKAIKPTWFIFENVPGLLSSDGGRDFEAFLGEVAKCGYGFAYRVLDSQYFGVPQRRRRLFVVGHSDGDWRSAFSVLFERESLFGNPPPSIKKGQGLAAFTGESVEREDSEGSAGRGMIGFSHTQGLDAQPSEDVFPTLRAGGQGHAVATNGEFWDGTDKTATLTTRSIDQSMPDKGNFMGITQELYENKETTVFNNNYMRSVHDKLTDKAPTLAANAEKGNVPLVAESQGVDVFNGLETGQTASNLTTGVGISNASGPKILETSVASGFGKKTEYIESEQAGTIRASGGAQGGGSETLITEAAGIVSKGNGDAFEMDEKHMSLTSGGGQAGQGYPAVRQSVFNIDSEGGNSMKSKNPLSGSQQIDKASTLTTFPPSPEGYRGGNAVVARHVVRRLTPIECERLQGFPDNYTQIPWKGKPAEECPDGVRYKALGNSMAVPVMKWIAMGIEAVTGVLSEVGERPDPVRVEQKSIFDF
jgi:DNA (cytosine-5)-methyltransferase 1